jgi:hypothetical protein
LVGLAAKQMEILKEIVPNLSRMAYISSAAFGDTNSPPQAENQRIAASTIGFTWQVFRPVVAKDYDEIFARTCVYFIAPVQCCRSSGPEVAHGRRSSALQRDCLISEGYPTHQRGSSVPPAVSESATKTICRASALFPFVAPA